MKNIHRCLVGITGVLSILCMFTIGIVQKTYANTSNYWCTWGDCAGAHPELWVPHTGQCGYGIINNIAVCGCVFPDNNMDIGTSSCLS